MGQVPFAVDGIICPDMVSDKGDTKALAGDLSLPESGISVGFELCDLASGVGWFGCGDP